ncbi:MAG: putative porin [Sedimentisphaerales bacterium]|nr:putative porin [Sedimentisphaerales bacterium]
MKKKIVSAIWILAIFLGGAARADDVNELKSQLAEQQKVLLEMQQRIEQLETNQKVQEQTVDEKISKAVESKQINALPDSLKWVENVKISGDLRYRHESIDSQADGDWRDGRTRHRIRARLGLDAKINDDWDVAFRIASGSADPVSTNQSLEDGFSSKTLWLDLAYFTWHPLSRKGLKVYGGKMRNPFYRAGENQLIWDDDLTPEGIAASYEIPFGENNKLYINGGGFWVDESSAGADTSLWGFQSYLKHTFENKNYLTGGASYYSYGNIKGRGSLQNTWASTSNSFFGNTSSGGEFTSDYDILEGFGEYGFTISDRPAALYGSYVKNIEASTSEDTGWLIGCRFNKAKDPGTWELIYNYRDIEADAVLGAMNDSDFIGGGTDGKGHYIGFKYQLAKNLQAGLGYFLNKVGENDDDYRRLQADLVFKF